MHACFIVLTTLFSKTRALSAIRNLLHANLNAISSSTSQDPLCPRSQLLWGDESEFAAIPALSPSTQVILFNTDPEQFLAYPDIPPTTPDATRMVLLRLTKPALLYALICVNGRSLKLSDLVSLEGLSLGFSAKMTKLQFRRWLSVGWQRHNARIISEWSRLVRQNYRYSLLPDIYNLLFI